MVTETIQQLTKHVNDILHDYNENRNSKRSKDALVPVIGLIEKAYCLRDKRAAIPLGFEGRNPVSATGQASYTKLVPEGMCIIGHNATHPLCDSFRIK